MCLRFLYNTICCKCFKYAKKGEKNLKKCLIFGCECVIIPRYAVKVWRKTCVDAGGGPSRTGKFLRSMSDFKPGEEEGVHKETCDLVYNGKAICRPELTATPASTGFIMCCNEKRGTL